MPLSDEQRDAAIEAVENWDTPEVLEPFLASADAEQLHLFVEQWNYDDEYDALLRVLDHPACDLATALMAFWRSEPLWYLQYDRREDVAPHALDGYDFVQAAQDRILGRDDWPRVIAYDPASDDDDDWTEEYAEEAGGKRLPAPLYTSTPPASA